jgi:hypothetical protein
MVRQILISCNQVGDLMIELCYRTLIGVGIVAVVIIAVALGVWRRRVYLRRTTIITTQAPVATTTVAMMAPPYSSNPRGAGYVSF